VPPSSSAESANFRSLSCARVPRDYAQPESAGGPVRRVGWVDPGVKPGALPRPRSLAPQKHIGGAGGGTARGAERSADDRTHGTGTCSPSRAPGLHPRRRAGYRVSIAR
jgi:hypothetical protein